MLERASKLPPGELPAFLDDACGADAGLRREIESLLPFYGPDTVTDLEPEGYARPANRLRFEPAHYARYAAAALVVLLVGVLTHGALERRLQASVRSQLTAALESNVDAYGRWMSSWTEEIERWSQAPGIREEVAALMDLTQGRDIPAAQAKALPPHKALEKALAPLIAKDGVLVLNVMNRENPRRVLQSRRRRRGGLPLVVRRSTARCRCL